MRLSPFQLACIQRIFRAARGHISRAYCGTSSKGKEPSKTSMHASASNNGSGGSAGGLTIHLHSLRCVNPPVRQRQASKHHQSSIINHHSPSHASSEAPAHPSIPSITSHSIPFNSISHSVHPSINQPSKQASFFGVRGRLHTIHHYISSVVRTEDAELVVGAVIYSLGSRRVYTRSTRTKIRRSN